MERPCPHLAPAVNKLLDAGAIFVEVFPGGEDARFIHQMSKGPIPDFARKLANSHGIECWANKDSHYPLDSGFVCRACRLAVAWSQEHEVINAI